MTRDSQNRVDDIKHALARSLLGAIPYMGQSAIELFNMVIAPPIEQRRNEWLQSLARGLEELQQQVAGFSVEALANRPEFVTTILHATPAALRSHQREKVDALRNAVLNVALEQNPDETLTLMFLSFIDTITPLHMKVLAHFDQSGEIGIFTGANVAFIDQYLPELNDRLPIYEQIVRDLYTKGLVESNVTTGTATAFGKFSGSVTDLGNEFRKFISSPLQDQSDREIKP